ncbi:hypothetical protein NMY22_g8378 [Coprinellus aureogranulatus]|nr:hypothetical protein NMY22_g8378 [Coprinellus aureogranulatus]
MNIAHELPSMPEFPPLEMPAPISSSPESLLDGRGAPEYAKSPVPSFADSFSTAYSSLDRENDTDNQQRTLTQPTHTLRKSISVDSFSTTLNGTRANPTSSGAQQSSPHSPTQRQSKFQSSERERGWSSRGRGASLSSVQDGYESPSLLDSDVERFDPVNIPTDRYRHLSLKGQDAQRPPPRGGELLLPARSPQALSAASSVSSIITGSANSSPREAHPALRSVTSLQASSLRSNQQVRKDVGRARSGSLGVHASSSQPTKRMTVNTQSDPVKSLSLVTLAVIGASTTGKSSVIRKGLANYHLSEAKTAHVPDHPSIRYSCRTGRIPSDLLPEGPLFVVEVDVPPDTKDLPQLPSDIPPLDGVVVCYDASNPATFQPVETLLKGYRAIKLPVIVLACKADLERRIEPDRALETLQEYDVGLVEVTTAQDGKGKMRQSFDWLLKAVIRARQSQSENDNRNPASPEYLRHHSQPWDTTRTSTPIATHSTPSGMNSVPFDPSFSNNNSPSIPSSLPTMQPTSPTRARSTGDLLAERDKARSRTQAEASTPVPFAQRSRNDSRLTQETTPSPTLAVVTGMVASKPTGQKKEPPATQPYATLDELLDKLLFLAVSGDDPAFVSHFLLTYRRFATPRSVLLAMQKRMRQLDSPCGDPMFACFAQMRICNLLETWIRDYPDDFAVKGTAGALNALIRSIISKTHLLHYGSEFLPFLEMLPSRYDQDAAWALKADISADESDDSYSLLEGEEDDIEPPQPQPPSDTPVAIVPSSREPAQPPSALRERKSSLPLPKAILSSHSTQSNQAVDLSPKQHLKDLQKLANDVLNADSEEFAQEVTRRWAKQFLSIKPRDWLHYVFLIAGKAAKNRPDLPTPNPIAAFNDAAEHLGLWTISLILAHDRPRHRVRQIEKFVDIAHRLRVLNNYAALRAIVAGINAATLGPGGEETMELFRAKCPEQGKNFKSFDVLLQQNRAHRAYRLALRNSKGACIPALEVHLMDLVRANEGNMDFNEADPTKIHWGKFNMMGRFIDTTTQCQVQCRNSSDYDFVERPAMAELLVRRPVMPEEMRNARGASNDFGDDDAKASNTNQPKDIAVLKKVFFW